MIDKPHFRYHLGKLVVCSILIVLVLVFKEQLVAFNSQKRRGQASLLAIV